MKALTVKQPWASLICTSRNNDVSKGIKDVENRTWATKFRGRVLIHASMEKTNGLMARYLNQDQQNEFRKHFGWYGLDFLEPLGAIIGSVEIVDCVVNHESIWAEKTFYDKFEDTKVNYNWVLAHPRLFPEHIPVKGKLSFWDYPNILAEPEEEGGDLFCHCRLPVKEENQVYRFIDHNRCRYCGGIWYK